MEKKVLKYNEDYVPSINDSISSDFEKYETYSRKKIDEKIKNIANNSQGNNENEWSGRTIVFDGDSITVNETIGYPKYVCESLGASKVISGYNGTPMCGNYIGQDRDFRRKVSRYPANTDAIIILGDVNDISTVSTGFDTEDVTKWAGRWSLCIDAMKKSFPTIPIFLVSEYMMTPRDRIKNSGLLFEYLANKYGCISINLAKECSLDLHYGSAKYGLTKTDHQHCSHEAMPLFADVILNKIKSIPPCDWLGTDSITMNDTLSVNVGGTGNLTYYVEGDQSVAFTSSNENVACVMGGVVYGMTTGQAIITVTTRSGKKATCTVTVS